MIDLKQLEESLDNALSNETEESLRIWLLQKRNKSYLAQLGEGRFESRKSIVLEFVSSNISKNSKVEEKGLSSMRVIPSNKYYSIAA